tara:strand:+ start:151 stop:1095 length:945 start_codon:yes stop_codon:yes gene_type:complete
MAQTTGTSVFDLNMNDLIEESFERCGLELRTGYDFKTARRSLNLLTIEWANRGINLWTIEEGQIPMVSNQITYALPVDTIDILSMVTRTGDDSNQSDLNINRISNDTYSTIPNKNATGRPIQVWINRQSGQSNPTTVYLADSISSSDTTITLSDVNNLAAAGYIQIDNEIIYYPNVDNANNQLLNCYRGQANTVAAAHIATSPTHNYVTVQNLPSINVWPSPNPPGDQYTFVYWRLRRVQDAGTGVTVNDIPFRFLPCMVAGLAYYLSVKSSGVDPQRVAFLQSEYEKQWDLASQEDREKASIRFVPRNMSYTR